MAVLQNPLSHRFDVAVAFAHRVHRKQARKATQVPYMAHLMGVTAIVLEYGGSETQAIAALLHDTLEDAIEYAPPYLTPDRLIDEIRCEFGDEVLAIVEHCTDTREHPKPSWPERKASYIKALEEASAAALFVSAADKFHNVRALIRDYRSHGDELWERFNPEAGKSGTLGYYRALVAVFKRRLPGALTDDLERALCTLEELAS